MANYRWGDGKGKVHSISLGQHKKNVRSSRKAKGRQKDLDAAVAPRGMSDILRDANSDASLRYGGQERALGLQQAQVPAWFAAYRGQVAGIQQGVNAGYQKAVDETRAAATAQQTQAGTDAQTAQDAAQKDAASRGATVDSSVTQNAVAGANVNAGAQNDLAGLLAAQQTATGGYYGGLRAAGAAAELGASQRIAADRTALAGDRGLYQSQYVSDARDKEHTKRLELKAYGLDVAKAQADVADDVADNREAARKRRADARAKGKEVNKFGYTAKEWSSFSPAKRQSIQKKLGPSGTGVTPKDAGGLTPAQRKAQQDKKIKASGRIDDILGRWELYKDTKVTETVNGKEVTRLPTPSEIKQRLLGEHFTTQEIHKALVRRHKRNAKRPKNPSSSGGGGGPHGTNRP
jgi:hypothetical protein